LPINLYPSVVGMAKESAVGQSGSSTSRQELKLLPSAEFPDTNPL